ncbi:MAG: hypothetical protein ORN58_00865, partial [Sediminibacterium sp.]|nr:hypothetical protein [Sediminibacterium sp.]
QDTQFIDFNIQVKKIKDSIFKISNYVTNLYAYNRPNIVDILDSARYKSVPRSKWDSVRDDFFKVLFPYPYSAIYNISPKIELPTLHLDTNFTVEMWTTLNYDVGQLSSDVDVPLLYLGDDSVSQLILAATASNGSLNDLSYIYIFTNDSVKTISNEPYQGYPKLTEIRQNVPFHIAITYKNKTASLYINGEFVLSFPLHLQNLQNLTNNCMFFLKNLKQQQPTFKYPSITTYLYDRVNNVTDYINFNSNFVFSYNRQNLLGLEWNYLDYRVKDFRIWNYARTNEQINNNYNKPILPDEYGLYYYLPLDTAAYLASTRLSRLILPNAATGISALKTNSQAEMNAPILKSMGFVPDYADTSLKYYPNYGLG